MNLSFNSKYNTDDQLQSTLKNNQNVSHPLKLSWDQLIRWQTSEKWTERKICFLTKIQFTSLKTILFCGFSLTYSWSWWGWGCTDINLVFRGYWRSRGPGCVGSAGASAAPWTVPPSGPSHQGLRSAAGCCLWTSWVLQRTSLLGSEPPQEPPEDKENQCKNRLTAGRREPCCVIIYYYLRLKTSNFTASNIFQS